MAAKHPVAPSQCAPSRSVNPHGRPRRRRNHRPTAGVFVTRWARRGRVLHHASPATGVRLDYLHIQLSGRRLLAVVGKKRVKTADKATRLVRREIQPRRTTQFPPVTRPLEPGNHRQPYGALRRPARREHPPNSNALRNRWLRSIHFSAFPTNPRPTSP